MRARGLDDVLLSRAPVAVFGVALWVVWGVFLVAMVGPGFLPGDLVLLLFASLFCLSHFVHVNDSRWLQDS